MSNQKALARKSTSTNTEAQENQFEGRGFAVQKKSDTHTHKSDLNTQLLQAKTFGHSISKLAGQESSGASPQTNGLSIQPKLSIGEPGDRYEQEADRIASQVVQTSTEESVQREAMPEDEEEMQMKPLADSIQRVEIDDEEELQMKPLADTIQRMETDKAFSVQSLGESLEIDISVLQDSKVGRKAIEVIEKLASAKGKGGRPKKLDNTTVKQQLGDVIEEEFATMAHDEVTYRTVRVKNVNGEIFQGAELDGLSLNPLRLYSIKAQKKAQNKGRDISMYKAIRDVVLKDGTITVDGSNRADLTTFIREDNAEPEWVGLSYDQTKSGRAVWDKITDVCAAITETRKN